MILYSIYNMATLYYGHTTLTIIYMAMLPWKQGYKEGISLLEYNCVNLSFHPQGRSYL